MLYAKVSSSHILRPPFFSTAATPLVFIMKAMS